MSLAVTEKNGPWIQLTSGAPYDLGSSEPSPAIQFLPDVVQPIAWINRYLGHTRQEWSVAAHQVVMAQTANLMGLPWVNQSHMVTHDNAEALVGDCPSPVKRMIQGFKALEEAAAKCLAGTFDYTLPERGTWEQDLLVEYDLSMLEAERIELHAEPPRPWGTPFHPDLVAIMRPLIRLACQRGENAGRSAKYAYLRQFNMIQRALGRKVQDAV